MTEILLNALINLFAIMAVSLGKDAHGDIRTHLKSYLKNHLRLNNVADYMELFELVLEVHENSDEKRLFPQAQDIARQLRSKLPLFEQHVFLLRYMEPTVALAPDAPARRMVDTMTQELSTTPEQAAAMRQLCLFSTSHHRQGNPTPTLAGASSEGFSYLQVTRPDFEGTFAALRLNDVDAILVAAGRDTALTLESKPLTPGAPQVLPPGAILRDPIGNRLYHAELAAKFEGRDQATNLNFEGHHLDFRYPESDNGLHDFDFALSGGMLVGVMGVSGAGKSTLLSILNGQQAPDSGKLLINGIDLHREPDRLEGVIGYVPQDDLLFEELSVFDNLYYNSALCMAHLDGQQRKQRVEALLDELNQLSIRDLQVGSPLEKTISGGQRKRLNIALELLREPSILFVDEPTSGLSSSDSENVMALLKAQSAKGKLVVVVIHQPSSLIYKMFDRLFIMDRGGRPIYDGNPLDAIVHFRSEVFRAGMDEYACPRCGHVNPEQLFDIIESKAVNADGKYTRERLISPERWHERYLEQRAKQPDAPSSPPSAPVERRLWRPSWLGQLGVFFMRTLKGRLANRQYLMVNLLEPPVLALLAALISHGAWGAEYSFTANENIATYFFISVIVALFLGLSVSAEEINRDQKILKREQFLNLSWSSYATSKTLYLFGVAALQMALFALVGNTILQIPNMGWPTLAVLFSCAAASAVLGLNISAAFKSAVTIYILIPLLLVPQMMLGGAVVSFDDLLHREAGHRRTPLVADLMPSRWGYEALVVHQYLSNDYMHNFLPEKLENRQYDYLSSHHTGEMRALADYPLLEDNAQTRKTETRRRLAALGNELRYMEAVTGLPADVSAEALLPEKYGPQARTAVKAYIKEAEHLLRKRRNEAFDVIRATEDRLRTELGREGLQALQEKHFNKDISNLVLNAHTLESVRLSGERLVQVATPISQSPESRLGGAQFMAAHKRLGSWLVPTYAFNIAVLWAMGLFLFLTLQLRLLPRAFSASRKAFDCLTCRKAPPTTLVQRKS